MVAGVVGGAVLLALLGAGARWVPGDEGQRMARAATPLMHSMARMAAMPEEPPPREQEPALAPAPVPSPVAEVAVAVEPSPVAAALPTTNTTSTTTTNTTPTSTTTPAVATVGAVTRPAAPAPEVEPVDLEIRHVEHVMRLDRSDRHQLLAQAREAAKEHMSDAHALKAWTLAAYEAGRMREARHAAEAWALHDDTPEPRILLARVLEGSGHRADAQAVLEEVLQTHPDSNEARRLHAKLGAPLPAADTASRRSQVARR
jgi:hypothetical protein